jgi:hypothetical protein
VNVSKYSDDPCSTKISKIPFILDLAQSHQHDSRTLVHIPLFTALIMTSKIDSTEYSHPLHKRVFYPTTGNAQLQSTSFNTKSGIAHGSSLKYHSRKARKGRYALKTHHIEHHAPAPGKIAAEPTGLQLRVKTVESEFKPHLKLDISFWLAVTFVLGSIVWVINGEHTSSSFCVKSARD